MKTETPNSTSQITTESEMKGKVEKKAGKRIGYNYIILKSLKESKKNDVIKCWYIKSLTNFGYCVIKEGTYGDSKDKQGRDIKDRLIWQKQLHEELHKKVRLPRLIDSFEEKGNYYLVIERIKGKSLYTAFTENRKKLREGLITGNKFGITFLDYLQQIVTLLSTLHQHQIVHRDISANNFIIMPNGKVAVIDMELSYSLKNSFPSPPFQLGTYGYMSPQQATQQPPAISDEVFSIGAILLQVWSGISPYKLTNEPMDSLAEKVYFLVPDKQFANIIIQCLHPDPDQRPGLEEVYRVISNYRNALKQKKQQPVSATKQFSKDDITNTLQEAISTLASPLLTDEQHGWFAENKSNQTNIDKNKITKGWYASFNTGVAGVLYTLSKLHDSGFDTAATTPYIGKALELIKEKYIENRKKNQPGLHFGSDGISVCLSHSLRSGLIDRHEEYSDWIDTLLAKETQTPDMMKGLAGQGIANLLSIASNHTHERLQQYTHQILMKQEKDGSWELSGTDKDKKLTRGFGNGIAGIVYYLLEYAHRFDDSFAMEKAERGLQWLIKKAVRKNGQTRWLSTKGKELAPWFTEGSPGIALTFLKAFSTTGNKRYKDYATGALNLNPNNIILNNLSQGYGLSGLGEIYLEAYQVTKDEQWLMRSNWVAQTIMQLKKQNSQYGPYWIVEHERQPVPGFMIGNSGVMHFLLRHCNPNNIPFPMLPSQLNSFEFQAGTFKQLAIPKQELIL